VHETASPYPVEEKLGLVDIRCEGEAFCSYGEKWGQQSPDRTRPLECVSSCEVKESAKETVWRKSSPLVLHSPLYTGCISTHKAASWV